MADSGPAGGVAVAARASGPGGVDDGVPGWHQGGVNMKRAWLQEAQGQLQLLQEDFIYSLQALEEWDCGLEQDTWAAAMMPLCPGLAMNKLLSCKEEEWILEQLMRPPQHPSRRTIGNQMERDQAAHDDASGLPSSGPCERGKDDATQRK